MPLQFRRGAEADLPAAGDAAVGEPLFTTDSGKLYIKKANGTFAEIGDGSDIDLSGLATGSLVQVNAAQDGFDAATQIPSAVTFVTTEGSGFSNAVNARLIAELPDTAGVLDIAQESTLQSLVGRTITAGDGLTGGGDLSADRTLSVSFDGTGDANTVARSNHTHAATELTTAATSTGYLKWTYESGSGSWSVEAAVADAPAFINGGDATADDPGN